MKRPRLVCDALMRYSDNITAAKIVMPYFPPLTKCGKMFLVSRYRRMHCNARQTGGRAEKKPSRRELFELH